MSDSLSSKTPEDFLNAYRAFNATKPADGDSMTKRDSTTKRSRPQFSPFLHLAVQAGLATSHDLLREFDISRAQLNRSRAGMHVPGITQETRDQFFKVLVPKAEALISTMR